MTAIANFDIDTTALVLVDITKGFLRMPIFGNEGDVCLANCVALADAFRAKNSLVVLTANAGRPGGPDVQAKGGALVGVPSPIERDMSQIMAAAREPGFAELPEELGPRPTDFFVKKHSWGAFFATDLDLQLRRIGVKTLVIGGIATNFGAETTAREAKAFGYNVIFAIDAMRALTAEEHDHSVKYTFPMIGQVRKAQDVIDAIGG
ncbi:MAG: isochorismatase family protein [Acidimicrobiales bacterium]|nr:isochorismatase family protein [Acidimicrobiales bacterium]